MHIRRQLREAIVTTLKEADPDVRVLTTHRSDVAAELANAGQQVVVVYHIADLEPQRVNNAVQGPRPTYRGFAFGVALIVSDDDAGSGLLDELSITVEVASFADGSRQTDQLSGLRSRSVSFV